MRSATLIWLCLRLPWLHAIDDDWRPNVSQTIQRSANRSKWRSTSRQLQVGPSQDPGFNTKRSDLCASHGQSVTRPEVVPSSLELCSYCRGELFLEIKPAKLAANIRNLRISDSVFSAAAGILA
eukprot:s293_g7.t1